MPSPLTLVEPCCGTAALSLYLLGAKRQLAPRQGSKWRLRRELARVMELEAPTRLVLSDASPWATAVREILVHRAAVLRELRPLVERGGRDPVVTHGCLHGARVPDDPARMTAELLWLQRMAWAGRCVRVQDGRWNTPGLNLTSALGTAATERFGAVRPLGPSLLEAVANAPTHRHVEAYSSLAMPDVDGRTVVYLDPPYRGTTGYGPDDLDRGAVVRFALECANAGAEVYVSEATEIPELEALGWSSVELGTDRGGRETQPFRGHHRTEWLTYRSAAQQRLFDRLAV